MADGPDPSASVLRSSPIVIGVVEPGASVPEGGDVVKGAALLAVHPTGSSPGLDRMNDRVESLPKPRTVADPTNWPGVFVVVVVGVHGSGTGGGVVVSGGAMAGG